MRMYYCPVLKGKEGEFRAVKNLSPNMRNAIFPIFEIPPSESQFGDEIGVPIGRKRTPKEQIDHFVHGVSKCLASSAQFGVDLRFVDSASSIEGQTTAGYFFKTCIGLGLSPVPVVAFSHDSDINEDLVEVLQSFKGLVVRVDRTLCGFPTAIETRLESLLQTARIANADIKIVLDFGDITRGDVQEIVEHCKAIQQECSFVDEVDCVVYTATSMPESVTLGMKAFEVDSVPRIEWEAWTQISKETGFGYGDYGVSNSGYFDADFREISLAGKVRYTSDRDWLIVKGKKLENYGKQFHELARIVCSHSCFKRTDYSWGDKQIVACAKRRIGPGNLTSWLAYTTNHHLTLVSRQLASAA
jgi:Beta protein